MLAAQQGGSVEVAVSLDRAEERRAQIRRGQLLEYFTAGYNSLEGVIAIGAGIIAGSIALVGFGFDSAIEVISGLALLWRLHGDADEGRRERMEQRALRIVGVSFFLLGAYVTFAGHGAGHRQGRVGGHPRKTV